MSLSGFLNLVKPPGMTSHDVVGLVRKRLPRKAKVGHLGTLDPAAAGVLPLALGRATKLIPLLPDLGPRMKSYLAHLQLGVSTTTDDLEGEVIAKVSPARLREQDVERALARFRGAGSQVPPQVSAVRQGGKRAYQRVRQGETVELRPRPVVIDELELLGYAPELGRAKIFMVCGSGTYVRSLARDLGRLLEVGGALAFLLRTHSGPFHLAEAVALEELLKGGVERHLLPCGYPFGHLPTFTGPPLGQKGRRIEGDFQPGSLLLAPDGLLRPLADEPGVAVVEAVFEELS